jgi:hypothetical protein
MKTRETCCVIDCFCAAPANLETAERPLLRAKCFCCGQAVCLQCSSRRLYPPNGVVRLCNSCQEEIDGDDRVVMRRMYKLAGY